MIIAQHAQLAHLGIVIAQRMDFSDAFMEFVKPRHVSHRGIETNQRMYLCVSLYCSAGAC